MLIKNNCTILTLCNPLFINTQLFLFSFPVISYGLCKFFRLRLISTQTRAIFLLLISCSYWFLETPSGLIPPPGHVSAVCHDLTNFLTFLHRPSLTEPVYSQSSTYLKFYHKNMKYHFTKWQSPKFNWETKTEHAIM